jgi:hypothetical protein
MKTTTRIGVPDFRISRKENRDTEEKEDDAYGDYEDDDDDDDEIASEVLPCCKELRGFWRRDHGTFDKIKALRTAGFDEEESVRICDMQRGGSDKPLVPCFVCNVVCSRASKPPTAEPSANTFWLTKGLLF